MCGRYRTTWDPEDWSDTQLRPLLPFLFSAPEDDVRPGTDQPIVLNTAPFTAARHRWGFLPAWAEPDVKPQINARSETVAEKPFWRDAIRTQRCVVAVTGYYEWSGEPGRKLRHLFEPTEPRLLRLAGLYGPARPGVPASFALLTCEPNRIAAAVHDRMPVILESDDALRRWLAPDELGGGELRELCVPCSEGALRATPPASRASAQGSLF